ncbi:arylsulfatase [Hirschia maritima]|uniref:arylsulfatase n=1 Tax=Hirschia maritima TaxID=1121961 RepID=UPI00035F4B8C|nr:arylsulfatase [Hirschia maritima]
MSNNAFKSKTDKIHRAAFIGLAAISMVACQTTQIALAEKRPNIVLMMTDDQGYGDLGAHGSPYLKTPNIERIGEEGLEMDTFVTYPNCSATRAGLLTGRYPYRTGVTAVTQVDHFMNASEVTLAEVLQEAGYDTAIFGKWHIGDNYPMNPGNQGFEEALVHKGGGVGQAAGPAGNTYFDPILEHNHVSKKYEGYVDDVFTEAALDYIEQKKEDKDPFFVYLATNLPHFPLQVPDHRAQRFRDMGVHEDNALTFGMIENIDYNVGRVLDKLKETGQEENTIVIFLSDNGPRHRRTKNDHYPGRWVANMRGTKTSVYEAGIRVPFFVKWPGKLPKGAKTDTMGTIIDLFPTLLEAAQASPPEGVVIDGKSLIPVWTEGDASSLNGRTYFAQMHYGPTPFKYMHFTARRQQYKLVSSHDFPHGILYQPTDIELKRVLEQLELYDVVADPSERINIASKHPKIVEELLEEYEDWFDKVSEERDAKGIQRIYLGTEAVPAVNLSRFDWGGPRVISHNAFGHWKAHNQLGHWRVKTEKGNYTISADLPEVDKDGVVHFKYNEVHLKKPITKGQKRAVFEAVDLPASTGNLHLYVKLDKVSLATGAHFVDVVLND